MTHVSLSCDSYIIGVIFIFQIKGLLSVCRFVSAEALLPLMCFLGVVYINCFENLFELGFSTEIFLQYLSHSIIHS